MAKESAASTAARLKSFETQRQRLPVHLRAGYEKLREQQGKMKELLATEEGQKAFRINPVEAMEKAGVKLDPALRQVLRRQKFSDEMFQGQPIVLPTGQVITPKVKVTFTTD
jgi:hypothetical protein